MEFLQEVAGAPAVETSPNCYDEGKRLDPRRARRAMTEKLQTQRAAGVLLHPTSLPGPYGIGDLGPAAFAWIDSLAYAQQKWWQILPLGPTGYGDSPYQSFSAFAGNRYLISPEILMRDGLIAASDLAGSSFPTQRVDYGPVIDFKIRMMSRAWENFQSGAAAHLRGPFEEFNREQAAWLEDYALFMALKDANGGHCWMDWPRELLMRQPAALAEARKAHVAPIGLHKFGQFLFFRQWREVRRHARDKGIRLIGDIPIFVSSDSADVWANPTLFQLDEHRAPRVVAGVPPDYFSATGQLWNNPLYDWDANRDSGYAWWKARLKAALETVDLVRLDHFRGFEAYWEIPAGMPTAQVGRWVKAPGAELMHAFETMLGSLPIIAEDLGIITPEVEALRTQFNLPSMRVLQFAFSGESRNRFLPHNYDRNCAVYSGTHDNDTTRGWFDSLNDHDKYLVRRYVPASAGGDIVWDMIRMAWSSVGTFAVAPLQDILSLGTDARMNFPGKPAGNWQWRFTSDMVGKQALDRLGEVTEIYGR
jgi:4-alpha-glucanotransferase